MNMIKKNGGFTLVELIVVIAILAILAGVAVPAYSGYIKKANDAAVMSELSAVLTAAQSAYAATTTEVESIEIGTDGAIKVNGTVVTDGSDFDTFYGSHTFATSILTNTSYATGAYWTSTNNSWKAGAKPANG